MKVKIAFALVTAFGLPVLLASANARQEAPRPPTTVPPPSGVSFTQSDGAYVISPVPPVPPVPPPPQGRFTTLAGTGQRERNAYYYAVDFQPMNAEDANLQRGVEELSRKLGGAKGSEDRSKIKDQLTEVLEKQFNLRQKRHQDEIKALEDKLKKLKDLVDKRQENRKEIVAKRLDQILSEAEGLGW